jgi:hypothetical protein
MMTSPRYGEPNVPTGAGERLTLAELQDAVWKADPAAFLVSPRLLRRVIKEDRRLAGFGLSVPHRRSYAIDRNALLEIADPADFGVSDDRELPERVILLARPSSQDLQETPAGELLIGCWRLLFHVRVHLAMEAKLDGGGDPSGGRQNEAIVGAGISVSGADIPVCRTGGGSFGRQECLPHCDNGRQECLPSCDNGRQECLPSWVGREAAIRRRIHEIGTAEFDEIRTVLGQEDFLLPPVSDESTYIEFVATYLELRHFAGSFLPRYFPGLDTVGGPGRGWASVDAMIGQDVDGEAIFAATRPAGAPDPADVCMLDEWADLVPAGQSFPVVSPPPAEIPSEIKYRIMMRRSQRPTAVGNVVRAAIYHARAAQCAPAEFAGRVRSAIRMDLDHLIRRLQAALGLAESSPQAWQESLFALVSQTPRGIWTVEARLLYDLQKVCVDHEREIYTVDLVEWALSWGRRPVKRHLPSQRDVLMLKHLRSAAKRLAVVRISDDQRRQLALLVRDAMERIEARLRQRLRPRIAAALDEVGLTAQNLPERVARKKIIEELLDQICERGFLAMGDLRDAISRNAVKLPDLAEPMDLVRGDRLLRADRRLALALDGVYRRGEIYLRWMQRASSIGFGTATGRFLTRFVAVPFGGSFVALAGIREIWQLITGTKPVVEEGLKAHIEFFLSPPVLLLGVLLLCVINFAGFRSAVREIFVVAFRAMRFVVVEPIRWFVQSPLLQRIVQSRAFRLLFRFIVNPLVWTGVAWCVLPARFWRNPAWTGGIVFATANLFFNSRLGRTIEEVIVDEIAEGLRRFGLRLITGLFWWIVDFFRRVVRTIERLMYSVDEWLRFRSGESRTSFMLKAGFGLVWFMAAYVLRFAVNVLIEPQINPIKHFPVVTVAHKLLFAVYVPFTNLLAQGLGIGKLEAGTIATAIIWCIPGVFGFLVWELKENWRLYAANRRRDLCPVTIGSHGENMARLLKPGFHSGTVPKRFAKLRRAERHARIDGEWNSVHKHLRVLHHVERAVRRSIEREFLELFAESKCWQGGSSNAVAAENGAGPRDAQPPQVTLETVTLSTNRVRLSFACRAIGDGTLVVEIDSQSGWLLAGASGGSWVDRLEPPQRQVLVTAMLGLYKIAGIELVRQQIDAEFAPPPWYDVSAQGLIVWPDDQREVEVRYDLCEGPWIAPQNVHGLSPRRLPTIERSRLMFSEIPLAWDRWVEVWNEDVAGQGHPRDPILPVRVLPS